MNELILENYVELTSILMIEDIDSISLSNYLKSIEICFHGGVSVIVETTLMGGFQSIERNKPQIVVLNLELPDSSQQDTLNILPTIIDSWPPIVVLSDKFEEHEYLREICMLLGAESFFYKKDSKSYPSQLLRACYYAYLRRLRNDITKKT
jgi:DNA-binding NarL/FixJ family response regulator